MNTELKSVAGLEKKQLGRRNGCVGRLDCRNPSNAGCGHFDRRVKLIGTRPPQLVSPLREGTSSGTLFRGTTAASSVFASYEPSRPARGQVGFRVPLPQARPDLDPIRPQPQAIHYGPQSRDGQRLHWRTPLPWAHASSLLHSLAYRARMFVGPQEIRQGRLNFDIQHWPPGEGHRSENRCITEDTNLSIE